MQADKQQVPVTKARSGVDEPSETTSRADHAEVPGRLSKDSTSLIISIVSVVISVVGALLSGVQARASVIQADLAREQLIAAQRLFDESGPAVRVSSSMVFYDSGATTSSMELYDDQTHVLDQGAVDKHGAVSLRVYIENSGREATTINDIWLNLGGGWKERHAAFATVEGEANYCSEKRFGGQPCLEALPYTLEPGRVLYVHFASFKYYYPVLKSDKSCADGIPILIDAVGARERPARYTAPFQIL